MKIVNQKPAVLSPYYSDNLTTDMNVHDIVKNNPVKAIFTPIMGGQPVIMKNNGKDYTEDDLTADIFACCGETINPQAEDKVKDILGQTLLTYNKNTNVGAIEMFVTQSATAEGLPEPSSNVIYTPAADVIPVCRQFLAGNATYDKMFASLAYYARPKTLGFYFCNEMAFNDFITWCQTQFGMFASALTPEDAKLCADFAKLTLTDLTESLLLRKDSEPKTEPYSFARLIIHLLMQYSKNTSPAEFGILPFDISELYCPDTLVFVNIEKHSKASAKDVAEEWKLINKSIKNKNQLNVISNKKITRLTAAAKALKKAASNAAAAAKMTNQMNAQKVANFRFKATRPTQIDLTKLIKKISEKMADVNKSQNVYKQVKMSYQRPSRRDPDDYNKQGKSVSIKYRPDIHLYIDTSGSISERDYEDTVKSCIILAKKMNVNMYFNSFSHILSQTTKLNIEGKSKDAIYKTFRNVPKVTGGTNYEQIWHFINRSKKRQRELSIIITDFEWLPRNVYIKHPANLYYVPCSTAYWNSLIQEAESFCKAMVRNEPQIRKHILF